MSRAFPMASKWRAFPSSRRAFPRPFRIQSQDGPKVTRVEIFLDSGKQHLSFDGASTTDGPTAGELLSVSPIAKEISISGGGYRAGTVTVVLKNIDRKWQQIKANEPTRNKEIRIYHHSIDDPAQTIPPVFVGKIDSVEISGAAAIIQCHDSAFERLNQPLSSAMLVMDHDTFPDIPEGATYLGQLAPVFYANHGVPVPADGNYRFPAYLIDPAIGQANYRYLIAQHSIATDAETLANMARRYGGAFVGADPTLTLATYGGRTCAVLDFPSDQRDPDRPDELELTHRFMGVTNASNQAVVAPFSALYHFLANYTPLGVSFPADFAGANAGNSASLASGNSTEAALASISEGQEAAMWIDGNPDQTYLDIIRNYQDSFPAVCFATRFGTFGLAHWTMVGARVSTLEHAGMTGHIEVGEDRDIEEFRVLSPEDVASRTRVSYNQHVVDDRFINWEPTSRAAFEAYLGEVKQVLRSAVYLQADPAAVSNTLLALLSPLNDIFELRIPAHWWFRSDIDKLIQVTHREIPSSYRSEMLKLAPAVYQRYGERYGVTAKDVGVNGLAGTYTGGFTLGQPGSLIGDDDRAVLLDGTGYITTPDNAALDPGDAFTIKLRVKQRSSSAQYLVSKDANGPLVYLDGSNFVVLQKHGVADIAASTVAVAVNTWADIAITKDGPAVGIYLDGRNVTGAVSNQTIVATASTLRVGDGHTGANRFVGTADEFALFSTALTASQIRNLHLSALAKFSPAVVARIIGLELNLRPEESSLLVRALHVKTSL